MATTWGVRSRALSIGLVAALLAVVVALVPTGAVGAQTVDDAEPHGDQAVGAGLLQACGEDGFEPNDTPGAASSISIASIYQGTICTVSEPDFFAFEAFAGEEIVVDMFFEHAAGDLDMALFDPAGVERVDALSVDDNETMQFTADADGTWLVEVFGDGPAENSYALTVCIDDPFEVNNSRVDATALTSGVEVFGHLCSVDGLDMFTISAMAGQEINIELLFSQADGDLDLSLFPTAPGNAVVESTSDDDNESISFIANETGDWLVGVFGFDGAGALYALTATVSDPLCGGLPVTVNLSSGVFETPTIGDDVILGSAGDDSIDGLGGDDIICGLGGNDIIAGGAGIDWIDAGDGDDFVTGGAGDDIVFASSGNDIVAGGDGDDEIHGGDGVDRLFGQDGRDILNGDAGRDKLAGGAGADELNGGSERDRIDGNKGADIISGGTGRDLLFGGGGTDTIAGDEGNDRIRGGDGDDILNGNGGSDSLDGSNGDDVVSGNGGDDLLIDFDGVGAANGGSGNDRCSNYVSVVNCEIT